ncbi:DUF4145 domain-containing protein [Yersinia enterocolitica]|uniref:DUF4145 domain-containing protein n=1 Tax=Yersinia TaxID=629 RepID=UPI003AB4F457
MSNVTLKSSCPHCLRDNALLLGITEYKQTQYQHRYAVVFACGSCERLTISEFFDVSGRGYGPLYKAKSSGTVSNIPNDEYLLKASYPKPVTHSAPEHTPSKCASFFFEAQDNLSRQRYETSIMLCRKVLDIATKLLGVAENISTDNLSKRVFLLKEQGKITQEMAEWAKIIRLDGNMSAHTDEEFTEQEAKEVAHFTETFLLYSFTLPGMVEHWKVNIEG